MNRTATDPPSPSRSLTVRLTSAEMTVELGRVIGSIIEAPVTLALFGELGAGKTTLCQGVAEGLAVDTPVTSPTFVLVVHHQGRLPLVHADAYRLTAPVGVAELIEIGLQDAIDGDSVCVIEWADRIREHLPADRIDVDLQHCDQGRQAAITGWGEGGDIVERIDIPHAWSLSG